MLRQLLSGDFQHLQVYPVDSGHTNRLCKNAMEPLMKRRKLKTCRTSGRETYCRSGSVIGDKGHEEKSSTATPNKISVTKPTDHVVFAPNCGVVMQIVEADGDYRVGQQRDTIDGQWSGQLARYVRHRRHAS